MRKRLCDAVRKGNSTMNRRAREDSRRSVRLQIESDYANIGMAAHCIRGLFQSVFDTETVQQLELAVVEGMNNVVEHAYTERAGNWVNIEVAIFSGALEVVISDQGRSMDPALLDREQTALDFDENYISTLPEGGMGLALIQMTMDDVRYESAGGINRLIMTRQIRANEAVSKSAT